jgi:hypothetical protein
MKPVYMHFPNPQHPAWWAGAFFFKAVFCPAAAGQKKPQLKFSRPPWRGEKIILVF